MKISKDHLREPFTVAELFSLLGRSAHSYIRDGVDMNAARIVANDARQQLLQAESPALTRTISLVMQKQFDKPMKGHKRVAYKRLVKCVLKKRMTTSLPPPGHQPRLL